MYIFLLLIHRKQNIFNAEHKENMKIDNVSKKIKYNNKTQINNVCFTIDLNIITTSPDQMTIDFSLSTSRLGQVSTGYSNVV